ncbi:hypothetical protein FNV43_RR04690 [Rhamnella rubrinervis]|uniref:Smr domain-containing protein n=1 Tax=Rhamnella rubrinervis TaxID=2594499 RepID=A0A8K0HMF7_9ROSA|nr:hypothetical protein FNV43_RR04690 [Rhamnella rubrinervis]
MKHSTKSKKKKRSQAAKQVDKGDQEQKVLYTLTQAFSSASIDDAMSAYREADGDPAQAAEILGRSSLDNAEDPSTSSTSSGVSCSGSGSASSEGFVESGFVQNLVNERRFKGSNQKRVVACTGTVSTVLGKDYVMSSRKRDSTRMTKLKGLCNGVVVREEAEQFLCSMLGNESGLSLAVVRDVNMPRDGSTLHDPEFCFAGQCGYDVEKALDALLDLSSSFSKQSRNGSSDCISYKEDTRYPVEHCYVLTDKSSDCTSHSSECELQDNIWSVSCSCRNYAKALASSDTRPTSAKSTESDLSQEVLESLFNIAKSTEHEPSTMNWRNVVKKLQLLGPHFDGCPSTNAEEHQDIYAKGDEYHAYRKTAMQRWDSVRSCYEKAATAYSKGSREYAAYLSDQGKVQTKLAREADERASKEIFKARNKGIENVITIDLHGQHVKQAMRLLKMHLVFVSYAQTVQILRVITGCGMHGMGRSKLKQSVVKLLEKEGIEWSEENRGTVLIKLGGKRELSFLDSDSDSE